MCRWQVLGGEGADLLAWRCGRTGSGREYGSVDGREARDTRERGEEREGTGRREGKGGRETSEWMRSGGVEERDRGKREQGKTNIEEMLTGQTKKPKSAEKTNQSNLNPSPATPSPQSALSRQSFIQQCYSIYRQLQSSKAHTRTLPNSTLQLLYQKPPIQAYGRANTHCLSGFLYGQHMRTHNLTPHRLGNDPREYQAYGGALRHGRRMRASSEDRWKRICRRWGVRGMGVDGEVVEVEEGNLREVLKLGPGAGKKTMVRTKSLEVLNAQNKQAYEVLNLHPSGHSLTKTANLQKTADLSTTANSNSAMSSTKPPAFIYHYTSSSGIQHYAKDRHGLTCYVDPGFSANQAACVQFAKKTSPIYPQTVRAQDRDIDGQMATNQVQSEQRGIGGHYLMPNCEGYRPEKYSLKRRKSVLEQAVKG